PTGDERTEEDDDGLAAEDGGEHPPGERALRPRAPGGGVIRCRHGRQRRSRPSGSVHGLAAPGHQSESPRSTGSWTAGATGASTSVTPRSMRTSPTVTIEPVATTPPETPLRRPSRPHGRARRAAPRRPR